jgi:hypothetical protein
MILGPYIDVDSGEAKCPRNKLLRKDGFDPSLEINFRLTFIRAKYFGRDMGVPELEWYVDVERSLDPTMDVVFPTDETAWDGQDVEDVEVIETVTLKDIIPVKALAKKKRARRVSVSSSDSDGSISQVLKEVVKDYAATHSRTTRAEGRMTEKTSVTEKVFDDLICFD